MKINPVEKEKIYNYHMIKQYDHLKKYLDILELMMNDIIIQLESYEENNLNIIKDDLLEIINKLNNSNLLYNKIII